VDVALVTGRMASDLARYAAGIDAPLVDALAARGATVHAPRWDDEGVDWSAFDVTVVRTPWDYPQRRDRFVTWAERTGVVTSLWNTPDVLRWNTHKSYLLELEERGAPVVPTAWLAAGDRVDLGDLLVSRSWPRAVIKPAVASGSDGLLRVVHPVGADGSRVDPDVGVGQHHLDRLLDEGDVLVQPYLESVERDGEVSVVLVDGTPTHAVRKTPVRGEFRIQEQFGGRYERLDLAGAAAAPAALARWVLEAAGHEFLYARVDLLLDENGAWQLAELEVTEPDLYLALAPGVATVLAEATLARA
jgi:glutathione synthase/RimK-type ligase-like ATP-grasp enzyme